MSGVHVEREGGRVRITLDHPPVNLLTLAVMDELTAALRSVGPRDHVLVIRGAGRHFSAGADVGEHLPETASHLLDGLQALFDALAAVTIPTISAVRGACLGAGLELAAACDLMIAAEDARLGVPEITLGVIPPVAAVILPGRVGPMRAAELVLTGRTFNGAEAVDWGLALEAPPEASVDTRVDALAARLASLSGAALRAAKQALIQGAAREHGPALDAACRIYRQEIVPSRDGCEGLRAFIEKREPVWQDR